MIISKLITYLDIKHTTFHELCINIRVCSKWMYFSLVDLFFFFKLIRSNQENSIYVLSVGMVQNCEPLKIFKTR
jgi:hypothetical protein